MDRIKLHDKHFKLFIPNEKIEAAIRQTAGRINTDFRGCTEPPVFLSVLNGSFMFTASLMKYIDFQCELSFVKLASYCGTASTGQVKQLIGVSDSLRGRRVIIVEDIVDSGKTITEMYAMLKDMGVEDIRVCTLDRLQRHGNRQRIHRRLRPGLRSAGQAVSRHLYRGLIT